MDVVRTRGRPSYAARRAAFDLTGLPPSSEQLDAYLADRRPDAYERVIDRLLDSPQYGERWARHWLDVAGYADSDGNGNEDTPRPFAYKYRDYVVRSFNADKPLDRFIVEQLAGDELVPRPWANLKPDQVELLAATGFLRMAADGTSTRGPDGAGLQSGRRRHAQGRRLVAAGADRRLRPVPRPSLRPDPAVRLLPAPRRLRAGADPALAAAGATASLALHRRRSHRSAAVEAEAQKLEKALEPTVAKYMAEALEKELTKFPRRSGASSATPATRPKPSASPSRSSCWRPIPSVNITEGVLYQYNAAAAEDLKKERAKIAAVRARKPVQDFVSVLDELPGVCPRRGSSTAAIIASPPGRSPRGLDDHRAARGPVRDPARIPAADLGPTAWNMHVTSSMAAIRWSAAAGQPDLDAPLRPRAGRDARRLRRAGQPADAPGAPGLAGRRAGPTGLEPEADAPADHDVRGLPAVVAARAGRRDPMPRTPGTAVIRSGGWMRRRCATASSSPAAGSIPACSAGPCR